MPECRSICGKPDDFVLPRPFDGQITQARDPQAVGQMPIDRGFDEIGRKESQRYRHVDLTGAASSAVGDVLGRGRRILDQLLEPTAPLRNRSNQCRFRLRPDGPRTLLRWVSRQKNFATPCWWCLAPRNVERVCAFRLAAVCCVGLVQSDDQSIRPNLDPLHIDLDKAAVVDGLKRFDMVANRLNDHILNLRGGDPAYRSGTLGFPLQEGSGKVISVSAPLLAGVARGHAIAMVVKQPSKQQSVRTRPQSLVIIFLFAELDLDCIEEFPIEDGQLLSGQDLTFECDLPKVEAITQQIRHTAARERNAADGLACLQGAELGNNALLAQIAHEGGEAAKVKIAPENDSHPLGLFFVDPDLAILGIVAERYHPADP